MSITLMCAPMVRVSVLPFRWLAAKYGAHYVFTEEIIDIKLLSSIKQYDASTQITSFVIEGAGRPLLQIHDEEKDRVIVQIGSNSSRRALLAAKMVEDLSAGINLNMGCPKSFSIHAGMGAALLSNVEKVKRILFNLVNNISIPVSCKIRLLESTSETLNLVRSIDSTGVMFIAVHGRTMHQGRSKSNDNDVIRQITELPELKSEIVSNGDSDNIRNFQDIVKFTQSCNTQSAMIAKSAMINPSVFHECPLAAEEIIEEYLNLCVKFKSTYSELKYNLQQMATRSSNDLKERITHAQTIKELLSIFNIAYYEDEVKIVRQMVHTNIGDVKRIELEMNMDRAGIKTKTGSFKSDLYRICKKGNTQKPIYTTIEKLPERVFRCELTFDSILYTTTNWHKSRQYAEQACASICIALLDY